MENCCCCKNNSVIFVTYKDVSFKNDLELKEYVAHFCNRCYHSDTSLRYAKDVKVYTFIEDGKNYSNIINNLNIKGWTL